MPLALLARMPPIMQASIDAGSGPMRRPWTARTSFTRLPTTPGSTRTRAPSTSTRDTLPVARQLDQQPVAHRLPRQAGAGGAEGQRQAVAAREGEEARHLGRRHRLHDGARQQAVDAGVVGVGDAVDRAGRGCARPGSSGSGARERERAPLAPPHRLAGFHQLWVILVPSTSRNFASHAGCAGHAGLDHEVAVDHRLVHR